MKGVKDIFACNNGGCKDLIEFSINTLELPDCSEKSVKIEFNKKHNIIQVFNDLFYTKILTIITFFPILRRLKKLLK